MPETFKKLEPSFYRNEDTLSIARDLLGKVLCVRNNATFYSAIIVETEAYCGIEDKACHAYGGRRTKRTETMYLPGGVSYVYFCYGIHHLLNFVTNKEGNPHAVLIRAAEPVDSVVEMMHNRGQKHLIYRLTSGPGNLTKAMGISMEDNACSLQGNSMWVEDRFGPVSPNQILSAKRIGVDYAEEYVDKPWRYFLSGNRWGSKK